MFHLGFFISSFVVPVSTIVIMYLVMLFKLWSKVSTRISKWVVKTWSQKKTMNDDVYVEFRLLFKYIPHFILQGRAES